MALIPIELIVLVLAALLSRAFNKYPPVWERFLGGLRYFGAPSERDVALFLKQATARAWSVLRAVCRDADASTLTVMRNNPLAPKCAVKLQ